jgi:hypothetical protein
MTSEPSGGPYVAMATFCEKVLQEKDGVFSIIRAIDRITISMSGPGAPTEMPAGVINYPIVITLRSGFAKGRYNLTLQPQSPSGKILGQVSVGILLEGDDRSANVILNANIAAPEEGLYWFDVLLEDQLLTRIPMRLIYQRMSQGPLPSPA